MNSRQKFTSFVAAGIAFFLIAVAWIIAMAAPNRAGTAASDVEHSANVLTVQTVVARSEQWPAAIEAFGNIVPWEEMIVSAQIEGQPLVELCANVGDRVHRGQVLARFDSAMLGAEVMRLRAEVEQARAEVGQAVSERDRVLPLADSGGVSKQEVTRHVVAVEVTEARLRAALAQLSARELEFRRTTVVAPDDGTISARNALPGMVGMRGLELFRIIRRDRLEWRGELTAAQLSHAAPGQLVALSLPGDDTARARIRQLAPALNTQTRLATVFADIESGGSARAGAYVEGRIVLGETAALIVPASSLVVRDGYSIAFKVAAGEVAQVEQQRVEVGRRKGTDVEILTGLSKGERVVTRGAGFLEDGDNVRVVGDFR
jgi:RND family efflux transporter MFP subunit